MRARKFGSTAALVVAVSMAIGAVLVSAAPASATNVATANQLPSSPTAADPAPDASTLAAPTEAAAIGEAGSSGKMVNVTADTAENSITWANPDGSFTTQETGGPVRIADASTASGWRDINDTLVQNADGTVSPKSGYLPLTLSGAASASKVAQSGVVAVADGEGSTVKFGWGGAVPQPTLAGNTATYTNVEPNLNIVVTMTATGFEQFFVLTAPPTASELNLALPMSAPGLSSNARTDGGINFTDSAKNLVGSIAPALMWDSRTDPQSGMPSHEMPLMLAATSTALDVASPTSFFADPNIQYPVTIDPTWSQNSTGDTFVRSDFPSTEYQSYLPSELQVGTYNGGASVSRSFLNFSTAGWLGAVITGASLSLDEFHSYNCTAGQMLAQWAGLESPSTDWTTQPGRATSYEGAITIAAGGGALCPAATYGVDVSSLISYDSSTAGATIGIALVAASETADTGWKRFNSSDDSTGKPVLTVTYIHTPSTPPAATFTAPSRTCGTATAPAFVNGTQALSLGSTVTDADTGTVMTDTAEVHTASFNGTTMAATTTIATSVTSATATSLSVTMAIPAGSLTGIFYAVRTQTRIPAYTATQPLSSSAWSGYCYFIVKNNAPPLPTIHLVGAAATTVGGAMQLTFSSSYANAPAVFAYWWVPDTTTTSPNVPVTGTSADISISSPLPADGSADGQVRYAAVPEASSGTVTSNPVTIAPPNTSATLWVAMYDAAGNVSSDGGTPAHESAGYALTGLSPDPGVDYVHGHGWNLDPLTLPIGSTVSDDNTNPGTSTTSESDLTLGSTSTSASVDLTGNGPAPVFAFTGAATDTVTSAQQVVDTTKPFTVSAWVQASTVTSGVPMIAVSQAASGSGSAAFKLGVSASGLYEFCVQPQTVPGSPVCAYGSAAVAGFPEFIAGIWDPANHQLRLLVGDQLPENGVAPYVLPTGETSSTGALLIGANYTTGALANEWNGYVTDPSIFPGIIDKQQLDNLTYPRPVN